MKSNKTPLPDGVADLAVDVADAVAALNDLRASINDNMRDNTIPTQEMMAELRAAIIEASAVHEKLIERAQGLDAALDKQLQVGRVVLQRAVDNARDAARILGMDVH